MSTSPYQERFLKYFFEDGRVLETEKFTVDTLGEVKYTNSEDGPSIYLQGGYACMSIRHDTQKYTLSRARIVASTFLGPPPDLTHTADHVYRNRNDDHIDNIRWLDKTGQRKNQDRPDAYNNALIITNGAKEMTAKEWTSVYKKADNTSYTERYIRQLAENKSNGFSYKEYPNLEGEVWIPVPGSKNNKGEWFCSNMSRMKHITRYAENVYDTERLGRTSDGYPVIGINNKSEPCHRVVYRSWFPEEFEEMKPGEMILHNDDDKLDFRPHMLRIGTCSENGMDAYDNGKFDDKTTSRKKCASYINGVLEKEHESQHDAMRYLRANGHPKARQSSISEALNTTTKYGESKINYGRTWKYV